jgi:ABC-2 type transport system ATP-binding protein
MSVSSALLHVDNISKRYGDICALEGVDLTVTQGEVLCVIGPNGAGKTTLQSIVAGLIKPDGGRVTIRGVDVATQPPKARRHVGFAPQALGVYPSLTVQENLRYFAEIADLRGASLRARLDEVADLLMLTELMHRPVRTLSGGQQRRVHTALALVHRPSLLLLDEPTTGVDVVSRSGILDVVRRLAAEGSGVCYSTHYLAEVEALDGTVAVLHKGRIVARGSLEQMVADNARSAVELRFDGPVPARLGDQGQVDDGVVRVPSDQAAVDLAQIMTTLGPDAARLRSVEFIRPTLDAVVTSLIGRRLSSDGLSSDVGKEQRVPLA